MFSKFNLQEENKMSLTRKTKAYLTEKCPCDLTGKMALVTGGNSGIGYKTAEILLYLGGNVILACRSREKAEAASAALSAEYPSRTVSVMTLDLASFASIERFASQLKEQHIDIDCFVNNAGVFHQPGRRTEEGFELVMGTNYFGTYYLSEQVLPYLETLSHSVTYINTISIIHKLAKLNYSDFYCEKHYGNFNIYAKSKLALARYTNDLVRRYTGSNMKVCMNHPGMSLTPIGLKAYGKVVYRIGSAFGFLLNSAEKSALSVAYILSHDIAPGSVVGPRGFLNGWGYPNSNKICPKTLIGAEELIAFTKKEIVRRR
jgi:NAD(P)-dependent dehydrogenase (short-subunit alcohol dehydrogenase family)